MSVAVKGFGKITVSTSAIMCAGHGSPKSDQRGGNGYRAAYTNLTAIQQGCLYSTTQRTTHSILGLMAVIELRVQDTVLQ